MSRIHPREALDHEEARQPYIDGLIEASGHDLKYVDSITYVTHEDEEYTDISKHGNGAIQNFTDIAICTKPYDHRMGSRSNIYLTDTLFDRLKTRMDVMNPIDMDLILTQSIVYHEDLHATHFYEGIPGVIEKVVYTHDLKLFLAASELEAHKSTIVELGELGVPSLYLAEHQSLAISEYQRYFDIMKDLREENYKVPRINKALNKYAERFKFKKVPIPQL
ncbi:MAG: hypothetical protein ACI83O_000367 [Patescibacteria group bacterium]|jgi:hypothetical protein